MQDLDRIIGGLEEFKDWSKDEFQKLDQKFFLIINSLDELKKDRWISYGKMAVLNGILIIFIEAMVHKLVNGGSNL